MLRGIGSLLSLWCRWCRILLYHLCDGDICSLAGEQFCVSSLWWKFLQFGWRTVLCVSGILCGSAWLHGSTVLQLKSFEPVVIHLSSLDLKNKRLGYKCYCEVKMSWASFLLAPLILFYYLINLFFPASSNEVHLQLLVWTSSFIFV